MSNTALLHHCPVTSLTAIPVELSHTFQWVWLDPGRDWECPSPRWAFWALSHPHSCSPLNGSNSSPMTLQMSHPFLIPLRTGYINTWKAQDMEYASGQEKWKATEIQWKTIAPELSHEDMSRQQYTLFKKCTSLSRNTLFSRHITQSKWVYLNPSLS